MKLANIREYLGESRLIGSAEEEVTGFSIDSRSIRPGELFFALPGEKVDGHQFVADALQKGACGAVVSRVPEDLEPGLLAQGGLIIVDETLAALQKMALSLRKAAAIPVVAVTGSNGKTTTKDLIASVLAAKYRVLKTQGNFNNEIGLPLTLLKLLHPYDIAVLEMGMRGRGQIEELCRIALPNYGVITNIGIAHYELLGSQEKIAAAKGELLDSLPGDGVAILNRDDLYSVRLGQKLATERPQLKILYYGFHPEADIRARDLVASSEGTGFTVSVDKWSLPAFLPLWGHHNVQNALAAIAVGLICQIAPESCVKGLAEAVISEKRLNRLPGINGSLVIDDTYNANPNSTIASLTVLKELPGKRKIAVLGSLKELGAIAEQGHRDVGRTAAKLGIDFILAVGEEAKWIAQEAVTWGMKTECVRWCSSKEEIVELLQQLLAEDDVVLVKGSRALAMEEIVEEVSVFEGGTKG